MSPALLSELINTHTLTNNNNNKIRKISDDSLVSATTTVNFQQKQPPLSIIEYNDMSSSRRRSSNSSNSSSSKDKVENNNSSPGSGYDEFLNMLLTPDDNTTADTVTAAPQDKVVEQQAQLIKELGVVESKATNMLDSVNTTNTTDSWGNAAGSLPPLLGQNGSSNSTPQVLNGGGGGETIVEDNSSNDAIVASSNNDDDTNFPSGQDRSQASPKEEQDVAKDNSNNNDDDNDDNAANFVNVNKILAPGSSQYYYSPANRSNRQMLEKVASKKKVKRNSSILLDDSVHSKVSIITERTRRSSYQGPMPLRKNGSLVRGCMRTGSTLSYKSYNSQLSLATTDVEASSPESKRVLKRCAFSSVDIREHERVAGDNPCVTSGVPLSIGWGYYQHDPISLDDYEFNKGEPRDKIEMMVPAGVRRMMLRDEFGVSVAEINASMREVNLTKRQRRHTVATEHLEGWSEVLQSAKRKFGRLVKGTSTSKEEKRLWEEAHKSSLNEYLKLHGDNSLGASPQSAGVGIVNQGPRIVPAEEKSKKDVVGAPFLEIELPNETPTF